MTSFGARFCPVRDPFWQNLRLRRRSERSALSPFSEEKIDRRSDQCGSTTIFDDRRQPLLRIGDGPARALGEGRRGGGTCAAIPTRCGRVFGRISVRYCVIALLEFPHPPTHFQLESWA